MKSSSKPQLGVVSPSGVVCLDGTLNDCRAYLRARGLELTREYGWISADWKLMGSIMFTGSRYIASYWRTGISKKQSA